MLAQLITVAIKNAEGRSGMKADCGFLAGDKIGRVKAGQYMWPGVGVMLVLFLLSCVNISARCESGAQVYQSGNFTYTLREDGGAVITRGPDPDVVVIPKELDGYPVREIGDGAFTPLVEQKIIRVVDIETKIKLVLIPDGVERIGERAFRNCTLLYNIEIPQSVSYIGAQAFEMCFSLSGISIPGSVKRIEERTFSMSGIEHAVISEGTEVIGKEAFAGCDKMTEIAIPESVKTIEEQAFAACSALGNIIMAEGLNSIGKGAFSACDSIQTVEIPKSVENIGSSAFSMCNALHSVSISGETIKIDPNAFSGSSSFYIECEEGSQAQAYAQREGIPYLFPSDASWL